MSSFILIFALFSVSDGSNCSSTDICRHLGYDFCDLAHSTLKDFQCFNFEKLFAKCDLDRQCYQEDSDTVCKYNQILEYKQCSCRNGYHVIQDRCQEISEKNVNYLAISFGGFLGCVVTAICYLIWYAWYLRYESNNSFRIVLLIN